jgi:hypothetical protein
VLNCTALNGLPLTNTLAYLTHKLAMKKMKCCECGPFTAISYLIISYFLLYLFKVGSHTFYHTSQHQRHYTKQGILTEGLGSVRLTSLFLSALLVLKMNISIFCITSCLNGEVNCIAFPFGTSVPCTKVGY